MNARTIGLGIGLLLEVGTALARPDYSLWIKTYSSAGSIGCRTVTQTPDGGYAMGYSADDDGRFCFGLLRTDENGDSLWSVKYYRGDPNFTMIQTTDHGFAFAGHIGVNWNDFWLMRIDENGDSLWSRTYGRNVDDSEHCYAMTQTRNGGFALAGFMRTYNHLNTDMLLLVTDQNGDSLWSKYYGSGICRSILQAENGDFLLTGGRWLLRIDENGDSLWARNYGPQGANEAYSGFNSIINTSDGGYALAGAIIFQDNRSRDFFLLKVDENGDSLWSKSYSVNDYDYCQSVVETADGGFLLVGSSEFCVIRTNEIGDSLWASTIFGGWSRSNSAILASEGGFAFGGAWGRDLSSEALLAYSGDEPFSIENPNSVRPSDLVYPSSLVLFPAYPNPFNSTVTIPFVSGSAAQPTRLAIFDPLGRRVADLTNSAFRNPNSAFGRVVWNASGIPAGTYLIRLEYNSQQLTQSLLLIK